jgi:hypothetical protein
MKKKHAKKMATIANHTELVGWMDYLHGDVVEDEFEAACSYEYARTSSVLRYAAQLHKKYPRRLDQNCLDVVNKFKCASWFVGYPWCFIWGCRSFPQKRWNQLSEAERAAILCTFPLPVGRFAPLHMNEVWLLDAMQIFEEFKTMAVRAQMDREKTPRSPKQREKIFPVIEGWPTQEGKRQPWVHALFTLDFSKGKKQLIQEFNEWLLQPVNRERFKKHERNSTGKTGGPKDRLKDLAAWQLYEGCGRDWNKANEFAALHRKQFQLREKVGKTTYNPGELRPFHNAGREQSKQVPLNQAPLHSEEYGFLKAKARAVAYQAELMPGEFAEHPNVKEMTRVYFKVLAKEAKKIS